MIVYNIEMCLVLGQHKIISLIVVLISFEHTLIFIWFYVIKEYVLDIQIDLVYSTTIPIVNAKVKWIDIHTNKTTIHYYAHTHIFTKQTNFNSPDLEVGDFINTSALI